LFVDELLFEAADQPLVELLFWLAGYIAVWNTEPRSAVLKMAVVTWGFMSEVEVVRLCGSKRRGAAPEFILSLSGIAVGGVNDELFCGVAPLGWNVLAGVLPAGGAAGVGMPFIDGAIIPCGPLGGMPYAGGAT
jgi:hypothetical protein